MESELLQVSGSFTCRINVPQMQVLYNECSLEQDIINKSEDKYNPPIENENMAAPKII